MRVSAYYFATDLAAPQPCSVRVHAKRTVKVGDLAGTNFSYAEQQETPPQIVFWRAEIEPVNLAVVMISSTEGYRVDHVHPADGPTRIGEVSPLRQAELALFASPAPGTVYAAPAVPDAPDDSGW